MKCSGATLAVAATLYRQRYLSLEGYTVSNPGQRPGIAGGESGIAGGLYAREDVKAVFAVAATTHSTQHS